MSNDDLDRQFYAHSRYAILREQALRHISKRKSDLLFNSLRKEPEPSEPDILAREQVPDINTLP